ncbi:MAG: hypothetical protein ACREH8_17370 [Opitutaceae bacterium]
MPTSLARVTTPYRRARCRPSGLVKGAAARGKAPIDGDAAGNVDPAARHGGHDVVVARWHPPDLDPRAGMLHRLFRQRRLLHTGLRW